MVTRMLVVWVVIELYWTGAIDTIESIYSIGVAVELQQLPIFCLETSDGWVESVVIDNVYV